MAQVNALNPIQFYAMGGSNPEEPKCLFCILPFSAGSLQWEGNLLLQRTQKKFQGWRSTYFDTLDCANPVVVFFPSTQQRIELPAGLTGYIPVIVSDDMIFQVTGVSGDSARLHLLNVDIDPVIISGMGGGSIVPANITLSNAPSVIGGDANGPATEIHAGVDDRLLTRSAGALAFTQLSNAMVPANTVGLDKLANASAQYQLIGRNSAGGGSWQDSSRAQLNIAGTDLANTFSQPQTISFSDAVGQRLTLVNTDPGAIGVSQTSYHNKAAGAAADLIAQWIGQGNSSTGVMRNYGAMQVRIVSPTDGAETSRLTWNVRVAGANGIGLELSNGLIIGAPTGGFQGAGTVNATSFYANGQLSVDTANNHFTNSYTVATLPAATANKRSMVTDSAAAPVFSAAVAGGGTLRVPVYADGATWRNG